MTDTPTITRAQVAGLLGIAPATLQGRVAELRRDHAFPMPVPCSGGRRYSRAKVVAWIEGRAAAPPHNPAMEANVAECEAILLGRARAMLAAE
jgi:predicted DNA-binding transcriptional regulator AlpA